MKKILMVLSLALTFALTAVQAEETHQLDTLQIDQIVAQLDAEECAELSDDELETQLEDGSPVAQSGCCRVCKKGKACGDSCIARDKTCRKGRGCACNG